MADQDVVIKEVAGVRAATLRDTIPSYPEQAPLWEELMGYLKPFDLKYTAPCFTLFHDECYREKDVDAEACQPVEGDFPETARVKYRDVAGAETMACLVHKGPYAGLRGSRPTATASSGRTARSTSRAPGPPTTPTNTSPR